ncbi:uncharacterized protein LOC135694945 [Rhopilema esculentum]|uniref:uncharacterized protein LOC135694945 n=1 Tax=Rhopilema esculentum TaxID=499914 RepID=UPI0031DD368E
MDESGFYLVLFVLSLFCHMTTCWILRLPCKTEANFSISAAGYALDHNVFVRLTMSLEDCKVHCMYTDNCQSLNYKVSGSENCELSRETNVSKPNDLVKKSDWTYYATNQKTTLIGSFCQREQPCKENEVCIDDCVCPGYRCIACSMENISTYCSALRE